MPFTRSKTKDDEPRQRRLTFWKAHGKASFQINRIAMGFDYHDIFFSAILSREFAPVDLIAKKQPEDVVVLGPPGTSSGSFHSWARDWMLPEIKRGEVRQDTGRKKRKLGRRKSAAEQPSLPTLFNLANAFLADDSHFRSKFLPRLFWRPCDPAGPDGPIYHTPQNPSLAQRSQPPATLYFHHPKISTFQFHSLFTLIKRHCDLDLYTHFNLYCDRSGKSKFAVPGDSVEDCDDLLAAMTTAIETMLHVTQPMLSLPTTLCSITPGSEDIPQLPLILAPGGSIPDKDNLLQFFTTLDVLIALPSSWGCPIPFMPASALDEAGQALKRGEYGSAFDDLPALPPKLPPPPPVPPHSSRLWMGQLEVQPGEVGVDLEDEDKRFIRRLSEAVLAKQDIKELATHRPVWNKFNKLRRPGSSAQQSGSRHHSPPPPPPQDIPKLAIRLDKLLGKGRLATAFTATVTHISHALSPHPLCEGQQLVTKAVYLGDLGFAPKERYGYTYPEAWEAVCREAHLLSGPLERWKRMRVAPRLYGVWRGGKDSEGDMWVVFLLEYCGEAVDIDQVVEETPLGNLRKAEIMGIYARMHEIGVVHGDVRERHILRHKDGWLRIIDLEGGQQRPEDASTEAAKAWEKERVWENGDVYSLVTGERP